MISQETLPNAVIDALEHVRRSGRASMGDQATVATLCFVFGFPDAEHWVNQATGDAYMNALHAVGQRVPRFFEHLAVGRHFRFPDGDQPFRKVTLQPDGSNAITIGQNSTYYHVNDNDLVIIITHEHELT